MDLELLQVGLVELVVDLLVEQVGTHQCFDLLALGSRLVHRHLHLQYFNHLALGIHRLLVQHH